MAVRSVDRVAETCGCQGRSCASSIEQAGVPIPSQDPEKTWTWDQFAEACKLISQKTKMKGFLMHNGGAGWDSAAAARGRATEQGNIIQANAIKFHGLI